MKIYLAYKFTGEDLNTLRQELDAISHSLRAAGHDVFCGMEKEQYFRDHNFGHKEIINYTLPHLETADALLAYIKTADKSEGMLLEIGYAAGLKKKVIVALKNGVKTNFVIHLASQVITFQDLPELQQRLENIC